VDTTSIIQRGKSAFKWYLTGGWQAELRQEDTSVDRIRKFFVGSFTGMFTGIIEAILFSFPIWLVFYFTTIDVDIATGVGMTASEVHGMFFFSAYLIGMFVGMQRAIVSDDKPYDIDILVKPTVFLQPSSATFLYSVWVVVSSMAIFGSLTAFEIEFVGIIVLCASAYFPILFIETMITDTE